MSDPIPEPCKVPDTSPGRCAYAGPDGKDACPGECRWQGSARARMPCRVPGATECINALTNGPDGAAACATSCVFALGQALDNARAKSIVGSPGSSINAAMRDRRTAGWRLPPELLARLDRAAAERGLNTVWVVQKLLEEGLDRARPPSEFRLTRPPPSAAVPPDQVAAVLLANVRARGDDYGDLANATADDLRDALRLAAEVLDLAAELLKGGDHPGPCVNHEGQDPDEYDEYDTCDRHIKAADERHQRLAAALGPPPDGEQ